MAIDFNKPGETDNYLDDVLTTLRDNIEAAVTQSYTGASNIPDRAIRFNETVTPARLEKYIESSSSWVEILKPFQTGVIALFGNSTAPLGWTRKTDWTDNSMITYKATGNIGSGGTANPKDPHIHQGGSHVHGLNNHTHSSATHNHEVGTLKFQVAQNNVGNLNFFDTNGNTILTLTNISLNAEPPISADGVEISSTSQNFFTKSGSGNTASRTPGDTGTPSVTNTASGGTVNTAQNTAPIYQEVIAATKD